MKTLNKSLMAVAVVGALAASPAAYAASGALFCQTGNSCAGESITGFTFDFGNALYQQLYPDPAAGHIWAQSLINAMPGIGLFDTASRKFMYQFFLPVTSVTNALDANKLTFINGVAASGLTGYFRVFVDTDISVAGKAPTPTTGAFFGDNVGGGGPDAGNLGMKEILAGKAVLPLSPVADMTQDPTKISYLGLNNGKDQLSYAIGGTLSVNVMVESQDSAYFRSDMIGTALDVDIQLGSLGPTAPFNTGVAVSDKVVGNTPVFGSNDVTLVITDETKAGAGDVGKSKTLRLNDFDCQDAPKATATVCDVQVQVAGSADFLAEFAPEPGSLALLGLGLAGLGFTARARRRVA